MRNKGKRAMLALILLGALFLLSGCVSNVKIKGASLDSAPTSGTLVLRVQREGNGIDYPMPEKVKIKEGSTITLKRMDGSTGDVVLKNPEIENDNKTKGTMDICFAYDGLKPGKYQIVTYGTSGYIRGLTVTLGIKDEKDVLVICLITLGKSLKDSTANLKAPIIINIKNNRGKQLILQDDKYKIKEPLE